MLYDISGVYQDFNGPKEFAGQIATVIGGDFSGTVKDSYGSARIQGSKSADGLRFTKTYDENQGIVGVDPNSRSTLMVINTKAISYTLTLKTEKEGCSEWEGSYRTVGGRTGSVTCVLTAKL